MLGLTQEGLAARLFVSQNYIAQIESGRKKAPSAQLLNSLQALRTQVDSGHRQSTGNGALKLGAKTSIVQEPAHNAYSSASEGLTLDHRRPATREECEAYVLELLNRAAQSKDPNAFPYILRKLSREFPLNEWER